MALLAQDAVDFPGIGMKKCHPQTLANKRRKRQDESVDVSRGNLIGMNLEKLKNDWESLAERDALWAILTDGSKASGKWDIAEFMATGEAEIEVVLGHLARINRSPDFEGTALDFGCGVGRLT